MLKLNPLGSNMTELQTDKAKNDMSTPNNFSVIDLGLTKREGVKVYHAYKSFATIEKAWQWMDEHNLTRKAAIVDESIQPAGATVSLRGKRSVIS